MVGGYSHVNMEKPVITVQPVWVLNMHSTWGAPARHPFHISTVTHSCPVPCPNLAFFITPLELDARSSISECYKSIKACARSYLEGNFRDILESFTKLRLLVSRCKSPEGHARKDCTLFRVHL
jgi:hypothetical protein